MSDVLAAKQTNDLSFIYVSLLLLNSMYYAAAMSFKTFDFKHAPV